MLAFSKWFLILQGPGDDIYVALDYIEGQLLPLKKKG